MKLGYKMVKLDCMMVKLGYKKVKIHKMVNLHNNDLECMDLEKQN